MVESKKVLLEKVDTLENIVGSLKKFVIEHDSRLEEV